MRALVWILLAAFVNATAAAATAPPPLPPIPLTTDLPSAIDSQLPNLGSAASVALPKNEQFQIGYTMMLQMRAQHQLLQDPEVE